jgi:hypothetical protein
MKHIAILSTFLIILSFTSCDRSKGKGSDTEWQQRQEEQESRERLDKMQEADENQREVRVN